jgi:hypothetical protein
LYKVFTASEPHYIALISYSEEQSEKNLKKIRQAVESQPGFKHLYPTNKSSPWDHKRLEFSNRCLIEAYGIGSSMRGGHFHTIIIDDPSKDAWTISLEQQRNFYSSVVIPALRKGGQIIFVGNPIEVQDILWVFETQVPGFKSFKFPAINADGTALWPEQYTLDELMKRKGLVGEYIFDREYLLKRINIGESPFKSEWVKRYENGDKDPDKPYFRVMTVDPSATEKGDPMAIVITDTDQEGNTWVVYRESFHVSVRESVSLILDKYQEFMPDVFGIETFVFQITLKVWLLELMKERDLDFNIVELEKQARLTYVGRIMALQPKIQSGQIRFREQEDDVLIGQILSWNPKSKTNRDDELVALSYQVLLWEKPTVFKKHEQVSAGRTFNDLLKKTAGKNDGFLVDFSDLRRTVEGDGMTFF